MSRKADFITQTRQIVRDLLHPQTGVLSRIAALKREADARGGTAFWLTQADFTGDNAELTEAAFDTAFSNLAALDIYVAGQNYDDTFYPIM